MSNTSRRRPKNGYVEVKGELSKIRLDMQALGGKLNTVEKDKENLRCINHALLEKIKEEADKDYPFKIFLLKKDLMMERERSTLTKQKLVENQILTILIQEYFGISIKEDRSKTPLKRESVVNILKLVKNKSDEEKELLRLKIEDYLERELVLNEEVKSLKEENRKLREEKMAESLSSQAIIESLEELVQEQKEDHEIMVQKLQNELSITREREAAQSGQICELKHQALSANEKLSESNAKINTLEKEKAELEMKAKEVKGKVMMLEEDASNNLAKLKELSKEVVEWRTRAEESGDRCLSLTKMLLETEQQEKLIILQLFEKEHRAEKLQQATVLLENEVESTKQQLRATQQSLKEADDNYKEASSNLMEMTSEMSCWKTQAEDLESKLLVMEGNNNTLEEEKNKLLKTMIVEYQKHLDHSLEMKSDIASLKSKKEEQRDKINELESENQMLIQQLNESNQEGEKEKNSKSVLEEELRVVRDENSELNDVIHQLNQSLHRAKNRRWWKKLVSCS
ncbi:repetitive organellar protein-like [Rhopilema esculentum]|uniref:repetitive organellar protein-like n=1 Tax=Rhopilema esculentum TaxID=499914 RepID=UPI0031DF6522|eukprot:gene5252-399_t